MTATIIRPYVPPAGGHGGDGFTTHDVAKIANDTAHGALVRHVAADGSVTWSVHRHNGFDGGYCDDPAAVADAIEVLEFLTAELREALAGRRLKTSNASRRQRGVAGTVDWPTRGRAAASIATRGQRSHRHG